jgi:hypothetical protein
MTEAELETADPQLLAAKLSEARSILYQVYRVASIAALQLNSPRLQVYLLSSLW